MFSSRTLLLPPRLISRESYKPLKPDDEIRYCGIVFTDEKQIGFTIDLAHECLTAYDNKGAPIKYSNSSEICKWATEILDIYKKSCDNTDDSVVVGNKKRIPLADTKFRCSDNMSSRVLCLLYNYKIVARMPNKYLRLGVGGPLFIVSKVMVDQDTPLTPAIMKKIHALSFDMLIS